MASFSNVAQQRRSSSSMNNATATLRVSISSIVNVHGQEHQSAEKSRKEKAESTRLQRRKSSLLQMGVANAAIRDVASRVLKDEAAAAVEAAGNASSIEKLQTLLTKAKERGMSAERLFEHFAPAGEASVTPAMFKNALRKLGQRAFDLDEVELEHLVTTFDTDENGTIELDEFMTFCLSIPSLPWRAEKARRLNNSESKDNLNVAARKIARRRSSLRAVPIGKLIHQGSLFFWRSKETIDVAFHYNPDEQLMTISTRCPDREYNYPAIFVDVSKIPLHKSDAVARANSVGQFDAMDREERAQATEKAMADLRVEYLQHRLKVPDEVNGPEVGRGNEIPGEGLLEEDSSSSLESEDDQEERKQCGKGEAKKAETTSLVPWSQKPGEKTPQERADDKAKHRPFLVKLSTDTWDSLLCVRNIVLQTPHRFEPTRQRPSMTAFRRASIEVAQLAKETEKLSTMAEKQSRKVDASISNFVEPS